MTILAHLLVCVTKLSRYTDNRMQYIAIVLGVGNILLLLYLVIRKSGGAQDSLVAEISRSRREANQQSVALRQELQQNLHYTREALEKRLDALKDKNDGQLENIRKTVEYKLEGLQKDNADKLEKMRLTVDEKLQSTLEKRLGESFKVVSDRLEAVHKGLGEMQTLATGVGDLQKVLNNVKTRGAWGEAQLGSLLQEVLNAEQYETNVITKKGSNDPVEFAIKIPGNDGDVMRMPIDAKLPLDKYEQVLKAHESGDAVQVAAAIKVLETHIKLEAKRISEKYVDPPHTTDFGIMYLPIEGLYAEVVQRTGLVDYIRSHYKVAIAGPTTILPVLNFVQMGYRTLAIQKRTSEVWHVLTATREEFGKFGDLMEKAKKKLDEASNVIDSATKKTRFIEGKLNKMQRLESGIQKDTTEIEVEPL